MNEIKLKNFPNLDVERLEKELNAEYDSLSSGYATAKARRLDWYNQYRFQPYGNELENQSRIVDSTIFNAIEWMAPALIRPFIESEEFIQIEPEGADIKSIFTAEILRELLTYQLRKRMDFYTFMYDIVKTMLIHGEAPIKACWRRKGEGEAVDRPDFLSLRPGSVRYDYSVGDISKSRIACHEADMTQHEIRRLLKSKTGVIDDRVDKAFEDGGRNEKTAHLNDEHINSPSNVGQGFSGTSALSKGLYLRREHWTDYDVNNDGTLVPIMAVFIDGVLVQVIKNPYPFERPPFLSAQCVRDIEGNPAFGWAEVLSDIQRYRTAILRLTSDNLNSQHNGMYEVDITNVDEVGRSLLLNAPQGVRLPIPVRKPGSIVPLPAQSIAPQTFNIWELLEVASENRAGFTRYSQGLDSKSLNQTATGITSIMQRSDMRMWEIAMRMAETVLKPMARMAIAMNQKFLSKQALRLQFGIPGNSEYGIAPTPAGQWVNLSKDDIGGFFSLAIDISLGDSKQEKLGKLMEFAQYFAPMLAEDPSGAKTLQILAVEAVKLMGLKSAQAALRGLYEGDRGVVVPKASSGNEQAEAFSLEGSAPEETALGQIENQQGVQMAGGGISEQELGGYA